MGIDLDPTDKGLSRELTEEELADLREVAARQRRGLDVPSGPPATPAQRRAAMALAAEELGWERPSASSSLMSRCGRCRVDGGVWCRRRGRVLVGFLHEERRPNGR